MFQAKTGLRCDEELIVLELADFITFHPNNNIFECVERVPSILQYISIASLMFICYLYEHKGVDIINGEYLPGVFFKGSRIFGQKNKGSQSFRRKLKGLKSISKLDHIFFKISIQIQTFEGFIYCSKTPAATSLHNDDAQL